MSDVMLRKAWRVATPTRDFCCSSHKKWRPDRRHSFNQTTLIIDKETQRAASAAIDLNRDFVMDDDTSSDRSSSPSTSQENVAPHVTIIQNFHPATPVTGSYPTTFPYSIGFTGDNINVTINTPTIERTLAPPPQQKPRRGKRAASSENIA